VDTFDGNIVPIRFNTVVNAAGPWAAEVARMAGIGVAPSSVDLASPEFTEAEGMSIDLPVEPRKRYIYMFYAENGPIVKVPLTIDPSGVFFKRHGLSNYYVCGRNQTSDAEEPRDMDLSNIDYDYFEEKIRPVLENRVPVFRNNIKVVNAWSGYYEYNTLDSNLIIGRHPILQNFVFANGSSGHGLQHAAAIGNAVTELLLHGEYKTVDLKRFNFERVMSMKPVKEIDVV
jgi:FAD-dependent oxidoreductase domain-containing protein 1